MRSFVHHLEEFVGCACMVFFICLTFLNVVLRYFFDFIISWVEEAVLIAFFWAVFLGAATAYRNDKHIAIDVVFNRLPAKAQHVISVATDVLLFSMNVYMTYLAVILCSNVGAKSTFVMRFPYFYIDLILVVSFGLMAVIGVFRLYYHWQDMRRTTETNQF